MNDVFCTRRAPLSVLKFSRSGQYVRVKFGDESSTSDRRIIGFVPYTRSDLRSPIPYMKRVVSPPISTYKRLVKIRWYDGLKFLP